LKLTTDRHEASRGLFVTAQLLVSYALHSTLPLGAVSVGILLYRLVRKNWNGGASQWWKVWRYV